MSKNVEVIKQINFSFVEVENCLDIRQTDPMFDIRVNDESVGFMVIEEDKMFPKLIAGIVQKVLSLTPKEIKNKVKEHELVIHLNFKNETLEVRWSVDQQSNGKFWFLKVH